MLFRSRGQQAQRRGKTGNQGGRSVHRGVGEGNTHSGEFRPWWLQEALSLGAGANLFQQQIQLAKGIMTGLGPQGAVAAIALILTGPERLDPAEPLRQPGEALLAVDAMQLLKQHRHADRARPERPTQIGLGPTGMAQRSEEHTSELQSTL